MSSTRGWARLREPLCSEGLRAYLALAVGASGFFNIYSVLSCEQNSNVFKGSNGKTTLPRILCNYPIDWVLVWKRKGSYLGCTPGKLFSKGTDPSGTHIGLGRKIPLSAWHANMMSRIETTKMKKLYAKGEDGRRERQKKPKILYMWDTAMHCILGLRVMWEKSSIYFSHSVMGLSTTHTRYNPNTSTSLENWERSLCPHSINKAHYIRIWGELRAPDALCCLPFCSHWSGFLKSQNRYGVLLGALAIIPSTSTPISLSSQ